MMKKLLMAVLAAGLTAPAAADEFTGELTVAFGYVVTPEGKRVDITGTKMPVRAWVLDDKGVGGPGHGEPEGNLTNAYVNDNGQGTYFYSGIPMPSSLDDVLLGAGVGRQWRNLRFGFNADITNPNEEFLIRWIIYRDFVPGLGAGVSAFSNVVADFGVIASLNALHPGSPAPTTMIVEILVSFANIVAPQNQLYMAQQFRTRTIPVNPNAPFRSEFSTLFSGGGATTGFSEDIFWFDEPPDGIYDETEADHFDGPPNHANFLLIVRTDTGGGTTETVTPGSASLERGIRVSGDLLSLYQDDEDYYVMRPGLVLSSAEAPVRLIVEGLAPNMTVTTLRFILAAKGSSANLNQGIELWNYTTSQWDLVDNRAATVSKSTVQVNITDNPGRYISSTRRVRTRMSWRATGPVLAFPWTASVDRSVWQLVGQ